MILAPFGRFHSQLSNDARIVSGDAHHAEIRTRFGGASNRSNMGLICPIKPPSRVTSQSRFCRNSGAGSWSTSEFWAIACDTTFQEGLAPANEAAPIERTFLLSATVCEGIQVP